MFKMSIFINCTSLFMAMFHVSVWGFHPYPYIIIFNENNTLFEYKVKTNSRCFILKIWYCTHNRLGRSLHDYGANSLDANTHYSGTSIYIPMIHVLKKSITLKICLWLMKLSYSWNILYCILTCEASNESSWVINIHNTTFIVFFWL